MNIAIQEQNKTAEKCSVNYPPLEELCIVLKFVSSFIFNDLLFCTPFS